jgi:hypothetical protein
MNGDSQFVTVFSSQSAAEVARVVESLRTAGIPHQSPGYNHAGMLGALSYIECQVRVPAERASEALALLDELGLGPAQPSGGGPTFRVRNDNSLMYAFGLMFLALPIGAFLSGSTRGFGMLAALTIAFVTGMVFGRTRAGDICSAPGCSGDLGPQDQCCRKCGREIRGRIDRLAEHAAKLEDLEAGGTSPERL